LYAATATYEECRFWGPPGTTSAVYLYRTSAPVTIEGGWIKVASGVVAVYCQYFGRTDPNARCYLKDVNWDDTDSIYWLASGGSNSCYGKIEVQKSLTLKVVDETTDGLGEIPKQYLTKVILESNTPESSTDVTIRTDYTPHTIRITANGYRTLEYSITMNDTLVQIIGLLALNPDGELTIQTEDDEELEVYTGETEELTVIFDEV